MNNTATTAHTFNTGASYTATSACDSDCVWTFTVTARTAKFVTLACDSGESMRVGVRTHDGVEYCAPFGTYSMAPSLAADRVA